MQNRQHLQAQKFVMLRKHLWPPHATPLSITSFQTQAFSHLIVAHPAVAGDLFEDLEIAPSGLLYDLPGKSSLLFSRTSSSLSSSTTLPDGAGALKSGEAAASPIATSSSTSETITSAAGVSSASGSSSDATATTSQEAAIATASTSYFFSFSPAAFLTNLFKSTLTVLGSTVVLGLLHFYLDDIYKRKYRFSLFESEILAYFAKKNILITGATSGIGECLAYRLASLENPPAVLYLHGRRREQLEKVFILFSFFFLHEKIQTLTSSGRYYTIIIHPIPRSPSSASCSKTRRSEN